MRKIKKLQTLYALQRKSNIKRLQTKYLWYSCSHSELQLQINLKNTKKMYVKNGFGGEKLPPFMAKAKH